MDEPSPSCPKTGSGPRELNSRAILTPLASTSFDDIAGEASRREQIRGRPYRPSLPATRDDLLRGFAVVVVEHAAQSLATLNVAVPISGVLLGLDQPVVEPLMIALSMIMMNEFGDGPT